MPLIKSSIYLAGLASCLPATALGSLLLYNQPVDPSGSAYASQIDTGSNGAFALVYDNFTLASGANITAINWVGEYFNPPSQAPISQFTLSFYTSNLGAPGPMVASVTIIGTAGETFVSGASYSYSATLPGAGFAAAGGVEYWLDIRPTLGFPPQWGWKGGLGGDVRAVQDFLGSQSALTADMAFGLTGDSVSAVPEPGQVVSLAGLLSAGLFIRRRLRSK